MSWLDEAAERIYLALMREFDEYGNEHLTEVADNIANDLSSKGIIMPEPIEPDHGNVYYVGTRRVEMHDSFVKIDETDRYSPEEIVLNKSEAKFLAEIIMSNER